MKLLNLRLQGFGQFNHGLDLRFDPDHLNLVIGKNEAGKSTVLSAIGGILFGFRDLNLVRKFEPWETHDAYAGELEVLTDDGRTLRFRRDFKTHQAAILELDPDGSWAPIFEGSADPRGTSDEDQTWFEHLGAILGLRDEAIFRSTVFFGQQSLQTAVSEQIRRLISGSSSVDYKGALHELHRRFAELTTENPWKAKPRGQRRLLEQTKADLATDRERLYEGRRTLGRGAELEGEIARLVAAVQTGESELSRTREIVDVDEKALALAGRADELERRFAEVLGRRDHYRRYADRTSEIEARLTKDLARFRSAPENLPELVRNFGAAEADIAALKTELAERRQEAAELRPIPNTKAGLGFGFVLAAAAAFVCSLTPLAGPAQWIAAAAAFPIGFFLGRVVGTGFREQKAALDAAVADAEARLAARRKESEGFAQKAALPIASEAPDSLIRGFREFQSLREERKRLQAAMKALGDREQVERDFADVSRDRGSVQAAIEELRARMPSLPTPLERPPLARELEDAKARAERLTSEVHRDRARLEDLRVELASLGARMDFDLPELEENVRAREARLKDLDLERSALKEAIDTLDASIKEFQESDVYRLSEDISKMFGRITGDRYSKVELGPSMEPLVSRGDKTKVAPSDLSQGAQDQLYFAMRVAMARHLSKNCRLPLFLDDPFVNFDADRLRVTRDVLSNLDGHQVILVTCNRDYEPWSPATIDLDRVKAS